MVLVIGFLLLVSLLLSAVISGLGDQPGAWVELPGFVLQLVNQTISLAVITGLFTLLYKVLPDVKIAWSDVWVGALFTAILFTGGLGGAGTKNRGPQGFLGAFSVLSGSVTPSARTDRQPDSPAGVAWDRPAESREVPGRVGARSGLLEAECAPAPPPAPGRDRAERREQAGPGQEAGVGRSGRFASPDRGHEEARPVSGLVALVGLEPGLLTRVVTQSERCRTSF